MVNLTNQPHFFVGAAMSLGIDGAMKLAIGRAVLIETIIAIGFLRLSL